MIVNALNREVIHNLFPTLFSDCVFLGGTQPDGFGHLVLVGGRIYFLFFQFYSDFILFLYLSLSSVVLSNVLYSSYYYNYYSVFYDSGMK